MTSGSLNGWMNDEPALRAVLAREVGGSLERFPVQDHLGAMLARVLRFHLRRAFRHDDGGRDAEAAGVVGDALGVIAGRHGDDAAAALLGRENRQAIEGAALLVGRGELQVLELEPDLAAMLDRQCAARIARRW